MHNCSTDSKTVSDELCSNQIWKQQLVKKIEYSGIFSQVTVVYRNAATEIHSLRHVLSEDKEGNMKNPYYVV